MHTEETARDAQRWAELVVALAGRVGVMAEEFAGRVREIPEYGAGLVPPQDLVETAQRTFALFVDALRSAEAAQDGRMLEYAADLGTKRARSGIPPSSLTAAVRLDFSIIWAQLLELAEQSDAVLLASRVEAVWRIVDEYATQTHASYLAERVRMAQEESSVRREFIAGLFGPEALSPEALARAGGALGVDPAAPLVLVAGTGRAGAVIRALGGAVPGRLRVNLYESGPITYGFWAQPPRSGSPLPAGLARVPCGVVAPVQGLAGLRAASTVAAALAEVVTEDDDGPVALEAGWHRIARRLLDDAGVHLGAGLARALAGCRPAERERLTETAESFLATGSVTETAIALFCHRNTVLNRLARFHELTGLDLSVPAQAAMVHVAWA